MVFPSGSYIEELLPVMISRKKTVDVLKFLADMTKTNATYVDTQLLCAVFRECYFPSKKQPLEEVRVSSTFFDLSLFVLIWHSLICNFHIWHDLFLPWTLFGHPYFDDRGHCA